MNNVEEAVLNIKNEIELKDEIVKGTSISPTLLGLFKQQYAAPNQGPTLLRDTMKTIKPLNSPLQHSTIMVYNRL